MARVNMPAAEVEINEDLVRRLLQEQHPDLAAEPLRLVANGWDNVIHRLGDDLAVRMPRRRLGAELVANEHRWLPTLAERLPIPIAAPVRTGAPGLGYPWRWSICPWFEGDVAADVALADPPAEARRLGEFVAELHTEAPADAPVNDALRGRPVRDIRPRIEANASRLADHVPSGVAALVDELCDVGEWTGPPVWLHGDFHTANMIVAGGSISAVLDFGDLTSGDPACDLAIAWMLFDDEARAVFRAAAGAGATIDDATWQRGRVWALHFSLLYLLNSADNERFARMGRALVEAVVEG